MSIIITGYILDLILGDPEGFPHPVRGIGRLISELEKRIYVENKKNHQLLAGVILVVLVVTVTYLFTNYIIRLSYTLSEALGFIVSSILASTVLATRCLDKEARKVYLQLQANNLSEGRRALSYIVSRDTAELTEGEVVRGTVETVAENISDGIIAPLFYLFIGGVPLAMAYKAINTLDSMVGYRNDRYEYFGKASAYLDDVVNYLPARLSVLLISVSAFLLGNKGLEAIKISIRDGKNHKSPNSGYPEAAVAGALSIQLGGTNKYFGKEVYKPTIGDKAVALERGHIISTIRLMYGASFAGLVLFSALAFIWG